MFSLSSLSEYGRRTSKAIMIPVLTTDTNTTNLFTRSWHFQMGAFYKACPLSRREGRLSSANKEGGRFFRCGHPHVLVQKLRIFQNLWCVPTDMGRRGWASVDKGGGIDFSWFCADDNV